MPVRRGSTHGQFCLNIVHAWMACDGLAGELYSICRRVKELCNLGKRFAGGGSQQLADADVFPCVNERVLADFYGSLANGADRADEASSLVQRRKNLRWFSRVEPFFGALEAAVEAQSFFRSHAQGFHYAVPDEVWKAYTTDWYRMDSSYRSFCRAFDACLKTTYDLPVGAALSGAMGRLGDPLEIAKMMAFMVSDECCHNHELNVPLRGLPAAVVVARPKATATKRCRCRCRTPLRKSPLRA